MASAVQIVNAAFIRLGEKTIASFTEAGQLAILANQTYTIYRDALLGISPWRFAIQRQSISADATSPSWEFDYAYSLPSSPYCLRVLTIDNASGYDWRVEGRKILTDIGSPIYVKFIARIEDPQQFDSLFTETLIAKLAMEWCESLEKDANVKLDVTREYEAKLAQAESVNGSLGMPEPLPSGTWVDVHYQ